MNILIKTKSHLNFKLFFNLKNVYEYIKNNDYID
jgi:hypothetical protein